MSGLSAEKVQSARVASKCAVPLLLWLNACTSSALPSPQDAARAYADAVRRGDSGALHGMLTLDSQQTLSKAELAELLTLQGDELAEQSRALLGPGVVSETEVRVAYPDGEVATLSLEGGEYRLAAADALPTAARTPVQALSHLRRALARRSYAAMLRLLSPSTRAAIEGDLAGLVEGLTFPEGLTVNVQGDRAVVVIPGGHEVVLKRESGIWFVENFD